MRLAGCGEASVRKRGRGFGREKPMRKQGVRSDDPHPANQREGLDCKLTGWLGRREWDLLEKGVGFGRGRVEDAEGCR